MIMSINLWYVGKESGEENNLSFTFIFSKFSLLLRRKFDMTINLWYVEKLEHKMYNQYHFHQIINMMISIKRQKRKRKQSLQRLCHSQVRKTVSLFTWSVGVSEVNQSWLEPSVPH